MDSEVFLTLLKREWAQKVRKNPNYSLRAFAKQLDVNSGALSQILSGKRGLSQKMILKFAERLNLAPEKIKEMFSHSNSDVQNHYENLREDQLDLLSDWAHFAIIEFTYVRGADLSTEGIAKRLHLPRTQVIDCVDRLLRLKILKRQASGRLVDVSGGKNYYGDDLQTRALRKYLQKRWFSKAIETIDTVDIEKRDHSGITMSIDSKKLPEAIKKIDKFRRELREFLGAGSRDEVYHLALGLFPLTFKK